MATLILLWLPILVSAVIVFVASSIMHMVLPYHRSDYKQLPDEDSIRAAVRAGNLKRGLYVFPFCSHKEMKSPTMIEKYKEGPVGFLTILPNGAPVMAKFLVQWFVFCLVVGYFVGNVTLHSVVLGAPYRAVFRVAAVAGFMAYGLGQLINGIWKGQTWTTTVKEVVDGLVYALLTAGTFGWLWPR